MNRKAETFFDDIIKALAIEGESAKFADLSQETAVDFFADNLKKPLGTAVQAVAAPNANPQIQQATSGMTFPSVTPVIPVVGGEQAAPANPATPVPEPTQAVNSVDLSNMDMQTLQGTAHQCTNCELHKGRKNVVFGTGNTHADLMFIGEGPGRDEDAQGIPFVGEAGQLLTKMINAMQFQRSDVYIANIVKCRPPNNRNPEDEEAAACFPYLRRQVQLVVPQVIVVLGAVPLKYLLGKTGITKRRGAWDTFEGIQVMPTFHPAYLLRNASAKKQVWEDLQKVMQVFGRVNSGIQKRE